MRNRDIKISRNFTLKTDASVLIIFRNIKCHQARSGHYLQTASELGVRKNIHQLDIFTGRALFWKDQKSAVTLRFKESVAERVTTMESVPSNSCLSPTDTSTGGELTPPPPPPHDPINSENKIIVSSFTISLSHLANFKRILQTR